jgi:hypothetical protein
MRSKQEFLKIPLDSKQFRELCRLIWHSNHACNLNCYYLSDAIIPGKVMAICLQVAIVLMSPPNPAHS